MWNTLNMNWKKRMTFVIVACFAYSTDAQTPQPGKCNNPPPPRFFDKKHLRKRTCPSSSTGDICRFYCKEGFVVKGTDQQDLNYVDFNCTRISGNLWWRGSSCILQSPTPASGGSPPAAPGSSTSTVTCPDEPPGLETLNIESAACEDIAPGRRRGRRTCEVQCKAGFNRGNHITETIHCQDDGTWSIPKTCSKITCPAIPVLKLSARNLTACKTTSMNLGESCDLTCKQGYEKSGRSVGYIECKLSSNNIRGEWVGYENKKCIRNSCPAPVFKDRGIDATNCASKEAMVGSMCNVQCRRGYAFEIGPQQKTIICQRISLGIEPGWSRDIATIGRCQKLTCSNLEVTSAINQPNIIGYCGNNQQSSCYLRCRLGYEFFDGNIGKTVTCSLKNDDDEPSWPTDIGTCQKKRCEAPQFPVGPVNTADCTTAKTLVDSKCTVHCPRGYIFEGESRQKTIQCVRTSLGMDPSWSPALKGIGPCQKLSCSRLKFTSSIDSPRIIGICGTSQESECSLSCQTGYEFSDGRSKKTVECSLRTGEEEPSWPANIGTCRKMKCDEPNFGGKHVDSMSCRNKWYGDSCNVKCNAGYKFPSGKTKALQCDLSAGKTVWLPLLSTINACQAITCPNITIAFATPPSGSFLPGVLNKAANEDKCTSGRTTSGSKCTLKCKEGYAFKNKEIEKTFTCNEATESWNVPKGGVGFCSVKLEKIANCEYWSSGTTANGKGGAELQCKYILGQTSVLAMPKTDIVRKLEYQARRYFVGAIAGNNSASWDNQEDINQIKTGTGTGKTGSCVVLWNTVLYTESCSISRRYMCERPTSSHNPCAINPCKSGGTCIPYGCSFKCKCMTDFYGHTCEKAPFDVNIATELQQSKVRITCNVASNGGWAKFELYVNGKKEGEITEISTTKKVETYYVDRGTNDIYISGKIFLTTRPESAFYKCEKVSIPDAGDFANITKDQCNGTVFHVAWNGLGNEVTSALPYDVYVNNDLHGHAISKIYRVDGLTAATDYDIKIVPKLEGCTEVGLFEDQTKRTSVGVPGSSTVQLPRTVDWSRANCTITWRNERRPKKIGGFRIKINEKLNGYDAGLAEPSATQKLFEVDAYEMKYSFATNPNSIYEVMVGTKPLSICGDSPVWSNRTFGCRTDSASPKEVRIPMTVVPNSEGGTVSMEISSVDERNGRVSCYFIVLLKTDPSASENSTSGPITDIDQLAQANETMRDGDSFVALALPRFQGSKKLILGDGRTTCCDMSDSNMNCRQDLTRRKRAADTAVHGENRELDSNANYRHYIVVSTPTASGDHALTASVMSDPWSPDGGDRDNNALVIILPIIFALFLVLVVVAIIIVRRKNTKGKVHAVPTDHALMQIQRRPNQDDHSLSEEAIIDVDVPGLNLDDIVERHLSTHSFQLANLYQAIENKRADEDMLFLEEFKGDINKMIAQCKLTSDISQLPANRTTKNRYKNIVPYDNSRVVLEKTPGNEFSDFINAAYIDGYKYPGKFIATQGPQPQTIADFWRMVWEQECYIITVLTNLIEKKKVKCAQYWPEEEATSKKYDSINVTFMETTTYGDYVRRKFKVSRDGKARTIFQFHFIAWPDHGIPNTTSSILRFHKSVIYSQPSSAGPIIVHCSAGVGRTGTFIALDILSEQISVTEEINICALVGKMRTKRPEMVQTLDQYIYIHKLVLELYQFGETDVEVSGFNAAYNNLRRINGQRSEIEQEFAMLDYFLPIDTDHETAQKQINKRLNRNSAVLPYDHNAVFIQMTPTDRTVPYYNASEIASYHANDKFIAAQTPDENSIEMFWRTVFDNHVSMIVSLCETKEEANYCYWPKRSEVVKHGSVSVRTIEEATDMGCVERKFEVASKDQKISVTQICYGNWAENVVPASSGIVLEIFARVEKHHQTLGNSEKKTTLVHCSDGSGRSGTFCAISNLIERLKNENRVDVFRIVKDLRDQRPKMVQSLEQYEFCYQAVNEFLQSFDLYGNFQ